MGRALLSGSLTTEREICLGMFNSTLPLVMFALKLLADGDTSLTLGRVDTYAKDTYTSALNASRRVASAVRISYSRRRMMHNVGR